MQSNKAAHEVVAEATKPYVVNQELFQRIIERRLYPPVRTKRDMVKRYSNPEGSEFGNASPTWQTLDEFAVYTKKWATANDAYYSSERFHLRNQIAGGATYYNLCGYYAYLEWVRQENPAGWYLSAMAPKHLLNGEIMRTHEGLYLYYSTVQKPMRDSLREGGREAKGVTVQFILKHYMNQRSYDWLMLLLDRYQDHVVEFTVVDRCWGTVPNHNTLFWEVRTY